MKMFNQRKTFVCSYLLFVLPTSVALAKDDSKFLTVDTFTRAHYLVQSKLMSDVNLDDPSFTSPAKDPSSPFPNDSTIECNYVQKKPGTGLTRKFSCEVVQVTAPDGSIYPSNHDQIKVRYNTHKTYSMVIATRLEKAMGFGADTETPLTKVICHGCSQDPFQDREMATGTQEFTQVSMETAMPGTEVIEDGGRYYADNGEKTSAWYWSELPHSAEGDALRLFVAFLKDNDTKAIQNKIICPSEPVNGVCTNPIMYVHDVGNALGSDGLRVHPLHLKKWRYERVWKYSNACVAQDRPDFPFFNSLSDPEISEAGRALFASRLSNLLAHEDVLRGIFATAHIEKYSDHGQHYTADDWVAVFKEKSQDIFNRNCATLSSPASNSI